MSFFSLHRSQPTRPAIAPHTKCGILYIYKPASYFSIGQVKCSVLCANKTDENVVVLKWSIFNPGEKLDPNRYLWHAKRTYSSCIACFTGFVHPESNHNTNTSQDWQSRQLLLLTDIFMTNTTIISIVYIFNVISDIIVKTLSHFFEALRAICILTLLNWFKMVWRWNYKLTISRLHWI